MDIREATPDDIDGIRSVARSSWETDYPDILSRETVEEGFEEWYGPDRLHEEIANPWTLVLVAADETTVLGFAHATVDDEVGTILRLYLDPQSRRYGHGRALFEHLRERLLKDGVERIKATVLAENVLGNEFYRDIGFEHEARSETRIGGSVYPENTYVLEPADEQS